ncbi:hypothetical protein KTT_49090 [Tengunoibacter tsumagoiensis]|uniref:Uncharacterized protein n=1 Tax=Tengunoibacter tsumagoiensis TaxID=2014871 RepID=A0A402A7C5_9CHLR|nr:hypothetical protein KTT_49090 [Tengunoibacter tsumagoiensis]
MNAEVARMIDLLETTEMPFRLKVRYVASTFPDTIGTSRVAYRPGKASFHPLLALFLPIVRRWNRPVELLDS